MITLAENPMPILLFGILAEAVLAFLLFSTRRGVLLWPMGGVLLVVVLGVLAERWIVTEKERVEQTLYDAAAAVQSNDIKAVEAFIAPSPQSDVLRRVSYYMGEVQFDEVNVRNLSVTVNQLTSPPTAEARFDGNARFTSDAVPYRFYAASFRAELVHSATAGR